MFVFPWLRKAAPRRLNPGKSTHDSNQETWDWKKVFLITTDLMFLYCAIFTVDLLVDKQTSVLGWQLAVLKSMEQPIPNLPLEKYCDSCFQVVLVTNEKLNN